MWSGQGPDEKWYYNRYMRWWAGLSVCVMLWGLATISSRELFFFGLFTLNGAPAVFAGIVLLLIGVYSGLTFVTHVKRHY